MIDELFVLLICEPPDEAAIALKACGVNVQISIVLWGSESPQQQKTIHVEKYEEVYLQGL